MSFTYTNTAIGETSTDYISFTRFTLDDKDSTAYEIEDEEITALYNQTLTSYSQIYRNYSVVIACGDYLLVKYSKQATFTSGGTTVQYSERAKSVASILGKYRMKLSILSGSGGVIYPSRTSNFL